MSYTVLTDLYHLDDELHTHMDRRTFAQLLALGGMSMGAVQAQDKGPPQLPVAPPDFEELARQTLPRATFEYISSGSADGLTLRENVAAFQRIQIVPPLLRGVSKPDLSTVVLGQQVSLPVLLAPVAGQRLYHPQGALASARAATAAGTIFGVSSSAMNSVEDIAAASSGPKWFQLYPPKDRTIGKRLIQRAEQCGYQAIIVTVDLGEWKDADRRNNFSVPRAILVRHLRDIGFEQDFERMSDVDLNQFNANAWDLGLTWEIFDWLRSITKLPLLIKGVLRPDDATKAVSIGLDGIVVSNHGGRRLDGMPATIEMLPKVVEAVGGRSEVFLDSGVRRGTDVLKALALGAKAVLIGRPYAWALAADGEDGVRKVLEFFRAELENALITVGSSRVSEVERSVLRFRTSS